MNSLENSSHENYSAKNPELAQADKPLKRPSAAMIAAMAGLALGMWAIDQLTKYLVVNNLDPANPPSYLGGFLKLRLVFNPGAAFSMGESLTVIISIFSAIVLIGVAIFWVPRVNSWLVAVGLGLLMGGILGNLSDRLFRAPGPLEGYVVDFISLPHFAIFNVADIAITSAAVLLVLSSFVGEYKARRG